MLGEYVSKNAVNYYTIPYNISGMIFTIPQSLITVAIPRLSNRIGQGDKKGYCSTLNQTIDVFMALLIPMCVGVAVLAYEILYLYCGNQYLSSLGFMSAVLIAACFQRIVLGYQCVVSNLVMYANSLERSLVLFLGVFGVCNVALNYTLLYLDVFSSLTALITTSVSYILFIIITYFYSVKHLNIQKNYWLFCGNGPLFSNRIYDSPNRSELSYSCCDHWFCMFHFIWSLSVWYKRSVVKNSG